MERPVVKQRLRLEEKERRRKERLAELLQERRELLDEPIDQDQAQYDFDSETDDFVVGASGRPIHQDEEEQERVSAASSLFDYTRLNLPIPRSRGIVEVAEVEDAEEAPVEFAVGQDWPERLIKRQVSEGEFSRESSWIISKIYLDLLKIEDPNTHISVDEAISILQDPVIFVLTSILQYGLEPSYLFHYKGENLSFYFNNSTVKLTEVDLYDILEFDREWVRLETGRNRLLRLKATITELGIVDTTLTTSIHAIRSTEDLNDISKYFELFHSARIEYFGPRRPTRSNAFTRAASIMMKSEQMNLLQFGHTWCLSGAKLGDNLSTDDAVLAHVPEDPNLSPLMMANEFLIAEFPTPESIMKLLCSALALDVSSDPSVRQFVRGEVTPKLTLSTRASLRGRSEIDGNSVYFRVKNMRNKPLAQVTPEQFLLIRKAQNEGLMTCSFDLPTPVESREAFQEKLEQCFFSQSFTESSREWGMYRAQVLKEAVERLLIPAIKKEVEREKLKISEKILLNKISNIYYQYARQASILSRSNVYENVVIGVYLGEHDEPCTLTAVNQELVVLEHLTLANIHIRLRKNASMSVVRRKNREWAQYLPRKDEEEDYEPSVGPPNLVSIINGDFARVFSTSQSGSLVFPEFSTTLKYAIGVAFFGINPIQLLCIISSETDFMSLNLHPLQSVIPQTQLCETLSQSLISVVTELGVDFNLALKEAHTGRMLPFVPGLGPNKVELLRNYVLREGFRMETKNDLLNSKIVGPIVFENLAGVVYNPESRDPYSRTRRHPNQLNDEDQSPPDQENVRPDPRGYYHHYDQSHLFDLLTGRDLYYNPLVNTIISATVVGFGPRHADPYPLHELGTTPAEDTSEYFTWSKYADPVSLRTKNPRGRPVYSNALLKLDNGLMGRLNASDVVSVDQEGTESKCEFIDDAIKIGQVVQVKIYALYEDNCTALVTMKGVTDGRIPFEADEYCVADEKKSEEVKASDVGYVMRPIQHQNFKNITVSQADEYLKDKEIGSFVFRPNRSTQRINLTIKFWHDLNFHIVIDVHYKQKMKSLLLGDELKIQPWYELSVLPEDFTYTSLDDIIVNFIDHYNSFCQQVFSHRKWKSADTYDEVQATLRADALESSGRVAYQISFYFDTVTGKPRAGAFAIHYLINTALYFDLLFVTPNGFVYKKAKFKKISEVLHQLKKGAGTAAAVGPTPLMPYAPSTGYQPQYHHYQ
ncbi:hypothetical protein GEMRC1_013274 [Eukaryota sp. GEM-RC1]